MGVDVAGNGNGNGNGHEKAPLKSKKFIAFLVSEFTWKLLAALVLVWAWSAEAIELRAFLILLAIVVVAAFVEVGYILGQASLDKFVRLAEITGTVVTKKGSIIHQVETSPKPDPKPSDEPDEEEEDPR